MSIGMNRHTGQIISGAAYLAQRIQDLVGTRRNTRIMLRHYGSVFPELVDRPASPALFARAAAGLAATLAEWIPEFRLLSVAPIEDADALTAGRVRLRLTGQDRAGASVVVDLAP